MWAPSNEAQKAEWTYISYESVYEEGGGFGNAKLHIHLLGMGQMLIGDVRITSSETAFFARLLGEREYMENGSFERDFNMIWCRVSTPRRSQQQTFSAMLGMRTHRVTLDVITEETPVLCASLK